MYNALLLLPLFVHTPSHQETIELGPAIRMIDLDGDGRLDRLSSSSGGSLSVALNRGGRVFEPIQQTLPRVALSNVLASDLNGDGKIDLYLVSSRGSVALVGDGTGSFREATSELGLVDAGSGISAERVDIDRDGLEELLLHNRGGDVIFWAAKGAFERDPSTPFELPDSPAARISSSSGKKPAAPADSAVGSTRDGRRAVLPVEVTEVSKTENVSVGGATQQATPGTGCATSVRDQAMPSACIKASSVPTLGMLYPISTTLFVSATGEVGIGTTAPANELSVAGSADISGALGVGTASPSNALSVAGSADVSGSLGVGTTAPANELSVSGDVDISGTTGVGTTDLSGTSPAGTGLLRVAGDVTQNLANGGLVKAACHIDGTGGGASVSRSFNHLPGGSSISVTRLAIGQYIVDFGADVTGRFYTATLGGAVAGVNPTNGGLEVTPRTGNANAIFVVTYDSAGATVDNDYYVAVY